jgi:ribosomal protein S18 acetylase RimI-like enzyme
MPHELLQSLFVVVDYTKAMVILALLEDAEKDVVIGVGQYGVNEGTLTAEVALVVRDDYQNMGVGTELLSYLRNIAEKQGLLGFTAEVLPENTRVLHLLEKVGFNFEKKFSAGVYLVKTAFREKSNAMLF